MCGEGRLHDGKRRIHDGAAVDLARQRLERRTLDPLLERLSPGDNMNGGMLVKTLREKVEASAFRARGLRVFCVFFLVYVFLGLCIFWQHIFKITECNVFFSDNGRAFLDMTQIEDPRLHHCRIATHPLFLLLVQTVVLLVDGVVNGPTMSVILVEACCGALSVCLFDGVLGRRGVERRLRTAFTLIYGCSFTMMLYSSISETFLFGGLSLLSFWYFLAAAGREKGPLSGREKLLAVFFGVVSAGVTLTNYVFYLVGLVWLLLLRYGPRSGAREFFKLNVFNSAAVIAGCLYQRFVWTEAPLFWSGMIDALRTGQSYGETQYMNWSFSLRKTGMWLSEMLLKPLMASDVFLGEYTLAYTESDEVYYAISFTDTWGEWALLLKAALFLFWAAAAACLLFWLAGRLKDRFDLERDGYLLSLLAAFAGNMALHYIYSASEAFIYSPHYLFYILLAAPLALERNAAPARFRRVLVPGLLAFWVIEVLNNLSRFFKSAQLALGAVGSAVNMTHSVKGTVMCGAFLLAALLCWERLRPRSGAPSREEGAELTVRRLRGFVMAYGAAVLVTSLFIAFNH